MPSKFAGSKEEISKFPAWVHAVAYKDAYAAFRATVREESTPFEGEKRDTSPTFLAEMHAKFPSMKGCLTDITCLFQLFEGAVNMLRKDEKQLKAMMRAINKLLAIQYPTDSQLGAYHVKVSNYRKIVRGRYGETVMHKYRNFLQFAGGSESRKDAVQYKIERDERQAEALSQRQRNKLPVTEASTIKAARKWGSLLNTVYCFCFAILMIGARKSEIILPTVSNFEKEESEIEGYIVQWGTAKEKGAAPELLIDPDDSDFDSDEDLDDSWALRRRVEKPILRIVADPKDDELKLFTVAHVKKAIRRVRKDWKIDELLDAGQSNEQIARSHDKQLQKEIRLMFPDTNDFAKVYRTNQLSTHFLRKLYANYGYLTLGDPKKETFAGWASKFLGWKPSSGLTTSISYSDIAITLLPPTLPEMEEATAQIQALVEECKGELGVVDSDEGSDDEDAPLRARVAYRRKRGREFIELQDPEESHAKIRVYFNTTYGPDGKRRKVGPGRETHSALLGRAAGTVALLEAAGVERVNKELLKAFGFGGDTVREVIDDAPTRCPPKAWGADVEEEKKED